MNEYDRYRIAVVVLVAILAVALWFSIRKVQNLTAGATPMSVQAEKVLEMGR
jgi:hypothetical protein